MILRIPCMSVGFGNSEGLTKNGSLLYIYVYCEFNGRVTAIVNPLSQTVGPDDDIVNPLSQTAGPDDDIVNPLSQTVGPDDEEVGIAVDR